jgi:hypothetical protein
VLLVYDRHKDGAALDLPAGTERVELRALDKAGRLLAVRELPYPFEKSPLVGGQQPSPMVEHTRPHPRLKEERPAGRREPLSIGSLFVPEGAGGDGPVPVFLHFHGPAWIAEQAAVGVKAAAIAVNLGTGSGVYRKAFAEPRLLTDLLKEAETKAGVKFGPVGLTAWSAGYGAVREILRSPDAADRVAFVVLLDALHAGYVGGKPGPRESQLVEADLEPFVRYARAAAEGKCRMVVTHTEVFPGTFASTTETADHLLRQLDLRREPVLKWGPMKTQQLGEAVRGEFRLAAFAGNSAPDHVDQLHALPEVIKWAWPAPRSGSTREKRLSGGGAGAK